MSTPSVGVAATFRDECNALPGFLETHSRFFDHIFLADCSADMTPSTDGSLDIIRKWGLPDPPLWNLSAGFGAIRSQLIESCPTDWVVIMDIDERMQLLLPEMTCEGTERYPQVERPNLTVTMHSAMFNHRAWLNDKISEAEQRGIRAVRFSRRHWFDTSYRRPCENWMTIRDFQLRCVRARSEIGYTLRPKMHERCWDFRNNKPPEYIEDDPIRGPFFDHFHCHFKPMEKEQREHDIKTYNAISVGD